MDFHNSELIKGSPIEGDMCRVPANASMIEVFRRTADGAHPYVFVEDEFGVPLGVVSSDDVMQHITNPSSNELCRWMEMPVEAALRSRIRIPTDDDGKALNTDEAAAECTSVAHDGHLLGVITRRDVLLSWRSVQQTLDESRRDSVTTLPNRSAFDHHLKVELGRAGRSGHSVAVILVDLDHFKQINDQHGHAAGDTALKVVGSMLRETLRSYDMLARYGGDEFAIVCCGCRLDEIDNVLQRVRENLMSQQQDQFGARSIPTISVGAAVLHDVTDNTNPVELVEAADQCLYAAKRAGRNCAWKMELLPGFIPEPVFVQDAYSNNRIRNKTLELAR